MSDEMRKYVDVWFTYHPSCQELAEKIATSMLEDRKVLFKQVLKQSKDDLSYLGNIHLQPRIYFSSEKKNASEAIQRLYERKRATPVYILQNTGGEKAVELFGKIHLQISKVPLRVVILNEEALKDRAFLIELYLCFSSMNVKSDISFPFFIFAEGIQEHPLRYLLNKVYAKREQTKTLLEILVALFGIVKSNFSDIFLTEEKIKKNIEFQLKHNSLYKNISSQQQRVFAVFSYAYDALHKINKISRHSTLIAQALVQWTENRNANELNRLLEDSGKYFNKIKSITDAKQYCFSIKSVLKENESLKQQSNIFLVVMHLFSLVMLKLVENADAALITLIYQQRGTVNLNLAYETDLRSNVAAKLEAALGYSVASGIPMKIFKEEIEFNNYHFADSKIQGQIPVLSTGIGESIISLQRNNVKLSLIKALYFQVVGRKSKLTKFEQLTPTCREVVEIRGRLEFWQNTLTDKNLSEKQDLQYGYFVLNEDTETLYTLQLLREVELLINEERQGGYLRIPFILLTKNRTSTRNMEYGFKLSQNINEFFSVFIEDILQILEG